MDNLGWAQELVHAPDLETIGTVIHKRLTAYSMAGPPQTEPTLAERVAFEHHVRHYMARANERGFDFSRHFNGFANKWVDFVNANKAAEQTLDGRNRQQAYERGRADVTTALANGWVPAPPLAVGPLPTTPAVPVVLSHEVHQAIDQIVRAELAKNGSNGAPSPPVRSTAGTSAPNAAIAPPDPVATAGPKMSETLARFLAPPRKKLKHKTKGHADAAAIVQFAIDLLGDPPLDAVTLDDWDRVDEALPDIPHPRNIPQDHRGSLYARYCYAQKSGWDALTRAAVTTIKNRYRVGLHKFIAWAIKEKIYHGPTPKFECIDENNLAPLPRDAFEDGELLRLISLPLFTGCMSAHRIWKPGKYFIQNHIYWGYLILILTGMRPGEVGQLTCADIIADQDHQNFFFDLRPFNARNGRVALKDLRNLKTNGSGRVVPIHPLLIDLGLLDRVFELREAGEERLFPEWEPYTRRDGAVRWSQPITKSWQYVKVLLKLTRADLTLYGTRHLMADWLDTEAVAQRLRDRILGHVSGVPGRYGRKGILDPKQVAVIEALEPPVVAKMREVLLHAKAKADRGELIVLKPWSKAWSKAGGKFAD